jgi:hypothetical protein
VIDSSIFTQGLGILWRDLHKYKSCDNKKERAKESLRVQICESLEEKAKESLEE